MALGETALTENNYKELKKEHLKADTVIINPSRRGSRETMSWIWQMNGRECQDQQSWLDECEFPQRRINITFGARRWHLPSRAPGAAFVSVSHCLELPKLNFSAVYRVNWLRAKNLMDCWQEECILLPEELSWTNIFYEKKINFWRRNKERSTNSAGMTAYAARQEALWTTFLKHGHEGQRKLNNIRAKHELSVSTSGS